MESFEGGDIYPGEYREGWIIFEVPENMTKIKIRFSKFGIFGSNPIYWEFNMSEIPKKEPNYDKYLVDEIVITLKNVGNAPLVVSFSEGKIVDFKPLGAKVRIKYKENFLVEGIIGSKGMEMMILEKSVKNAITKIKGGIKAFLKGLPVRLSLNPYIGCSHCCVYCYNKFLIRFRKEYNKLEDVCNIIIVKENLPEILKKEIKRVEKSVLWIGSISDPYQPIEKKYEITRKCLEVLVNEKFPFSIYTKSDLVLRDLDLIKESLSEVIFTITSLDKEFKKIFEPGSPSYDRVLEALEEVSKVTNTRVAILPIIPSFNDDVEMLKKLIKEVKYRGVKNVFVGFFEVDTFSNKKHKRKTWRKI